mgnify:CR=1 FL=1
MFGTVQKLNQSDPNTGDVLLGDKVLNQKPFYKYLELYLDEHLTFEEHTTKLFNKYINYLVN